MSDACCHVAAVVVNRDKPVQTVVVNRPQPVTVVTKVLRGPAGPPGPSGGSVHLLAGEAILAYDPVYGFNNNVFVASNSDLVNFDKFVGIAENAGAIGQNIVVRTEGEIQNPAWNWTKNSFIWLDNGVLTENFPAVTPTLYRQFIGKAISPVKIVVNISEPILYNI